jgi:NADPH:quinone reductase-like Zn-dependent oxidoreductase
VGSIVVQLAKKVFHLTVIGTASRPETVEFALKQGADYVINHNGDILQF